MTLMVEEIVIGISVLTIFGAVAAIWRLRCSFDDRRKVYRWLKINTEDKSGRDTATTTEIASGIRMEEARVRKACLQHKKIIMCNTEEERWSLFNSQPKSVYEKRGVRFL